MEKKYYFSLHILKYGSKIIDRYGRFLTSFANSNTFKKFNTEGIENPIFDFDNSSHYHSTKRLSSWKKFLIYIFIDVIYIGLKICRCRCLVIYSFQTAEEFETEVIECHNTFRKLHGAPPLRNSTACRQVAQNWAETISETGHFEHNVSQPDFGESIFKGNSLTTGHSWNLIIIM